MHLTWYIGCQIKVNTYDQEISQSHITVQATENTEADDPTPEEEAAVRAALQEKELEAEFEEHLEHDDERDEDDIVDDDGEGADQFDDDE